jgi:hypothetical protein
VNDQESRDDLIALCDAVRLAGLPEPPRSVNTESTPLLFPLPTTLLDQLTDWRTEAAHQLDREEVADADVLRVLIWILIADEGLTARVIDTLRRESG